MLWYDRWSIKGIIGKQLGGVKIQLQDVGITLKDLWNGGNWNWDRVSTTIPDWLKGEVHSLSDEITWDIPLMLLTLPLLHSIG